jgi:hypothetical protein
MNEEIKAKLDLITFHINDLRLNEIKAGNMDGGNYVAVEDVEKLINELMAKKDKK